MGKVTKEEVKAIEVQGIVIYCIKKPYPMVV